LHAVDEAGQLIEAELAIVAQVVDVDISAHAVYIVLFKCLDGSRFS